MSNKPKKAPTQPTTAPLALIDGTHLIPADDTVRRALDRMRPGHVVHLQGSLVNLSAPDGWCWNSSLVRDDMGAGACELFWVTRAWIDNDTKT